LGDEPGPAPLVQFKRGGQLNTAELLKRFQGEGISLTAQDLKVRE
jgi:hypothetical protein